MFHLVALGPLNVSLIYRPAYAENIIFDELDCLVTDLFELKGDSILLTSFKIDVLDNLPCTTQNMDLFGKPLDFLCK